MTYYTITREKTSPVALTIYVLLATVALLFTIYEIKAITSEEVIDVSSVSGKHYVLGSCAEGNDESRLCGKRMSSLGN